MRTATRPAPPHTRCRPWLRRRRSVRPPARQNASEPTSQARIVKASPTLRIGHRCRTPAENGMRGDVGLARVGANDASPKSPCLRGRRADSACRLARHAALDRSLEMRRVVRPGCTPIRPADLAADDDGGCRLALAMGRKLLVRGPVLGPAGRGAEVRGRARGGRHDGRRHPTRPTPGGIRPAMRGVERDRCHSFAG